MLSGVPPEGQGSDQLPEASTTAKPTAMPSTVTVTVCPGVLRPLKIGVPEAVPMFMGVCTVREQPPQEPEAPLQSCPV